MATTTDHLLLPELRPFRFCPPPRFVLIFEEHKKNPGDVMMTDLFNHSANPEKPEKLRKSIWRWPAGVVASGLAGAAAVVAFRGCWHGNMGWPVGVQGYSYQVCLSCGAMRLFDETTFMAYGPFRNDLNELIAWAFHSGRTHA
jgi:hypothetical protein